MRVDVPDLSDVIGAIPYRMALAGGWIDQPFISGLNPTLTGSMVVVGVQPSFRFMERCGMATGTRRAMLKLWKNGLPAGKPMDLVKQVYACENENQSDPSGSQDMIGLIYPGISRLDYNSEFESGVFPKNIETCNDATVVHWLQNVVHVLPVEPRPAGYSPLGTRNLDPAWARRLGQSGRDCFDAIVKKDLNGLADSMNLCMAAWEALLPATVIHPSLKVDLCNLIKVYQKRYPGAMYSGCGGGYLYVISEEPVPGAFHVQIRTAES